MVRMEINGGRITGIENCFKALAEAGVARYGIKRVGEEITKFFAGLAQGEAVRTVSSRTPMILESVQDGAGHSVILWMDI